MNNNFSRYRHIVVGPFEFNSEHFCGRSPFSGLSPKPLHNERAHTMATENEVEYVRDFDIYDTKEALILSLKFALVKDLHSNDR